MHKFADFYVNKDFYAFEEVQLKKFEIQLQLKELEMKREGIKLLKQSNETKKQDLQLQASHSFFWQRRKRKKYMAEALAYEQSEDHTTEVINELGQQIEDLKRELKDARYNHGGMNIQGKRIRVNFTNRSRSMSSSENTIDKQMEK